MASLVSRATGNFTSAGTWGLVDSTSELDSNASNVVIGTTNIDSATFTPGAITVEGIALKIQNRAASPSGTFTVTLRNSTGGVDVTSVTVNVSDLPYNATAPSLGYGWVFFKFSSSQLLLAATAYLVRCVCSASGSQVTLWRNGTSNNVCRKLVTTTTQAPATGDQLTICKEWTAAATGTNITVTLDNTATGAFGATVSGGPPESIVIGQGGTLVSGTSGSTAYYLKVKGIIHVTGGGLFKIGESGTPIPSTSSFTLYFDSTTSLDAGLVVDTLGTFTMQGATKNHATTLTANAAASATVLTLGSTSGWAVSDVLGLGPGNVARTEYQTATILTVDSATQVTLTAGISAQKRGTAPHLTEVINLTRNIIIRGVSSSLRGFLSFREACTATMRYASIEFMGSSFTNVGKMCIDFQANVTGAVTVEYCAFQAGYNNTPSIMMHTSKTGTLTARYNVCYKNGNRFFYSNSSSYSSLVLTDNVCIGGEDGASVIDFNLYGLNVTDCRRNVISGSPNTNGYGIVLNIGGNVGVHDFTNVFDNCRMSYTGIAGFYINPANGNIMVGKISGMQSYMNASRGIRITASDAVVIDFEDCALWGNNSSGEGIEFGGDTGAHMEITMRRCTFAASSLQTQSWGILVATRYLKLRLEACTFGVVSGIYTAHGTADIATDRAFLYMDLTTVGCTFASSTEFAGFTDSRHVRLIRHQKYDGTANDNRVDKKVNSTDSWSIRRDTSVYNNASPSEKITPSITQTWTKARSASWFVAVESGAPKTLGVYVRKSSAGAGDSASYTGAQPRLILKANPAAGVTSDQVIDTMSAAIGTWEQLTGATPSPSENCVFEVYVDCDGAAGFINVDDRTAT